MEQTEEFSNVSYTEIENVLEHNCSDLLKEISKYKNKKGYTFTLQRTTVEKMAYLTNIPIIMNILNEDSYQEDKHLFKCFVVFIFDDKGWAIDFRFMVSKDKPCS